MQHPPMMSSVASIIAETLLLALVFLGVGASSSIFWHAAAGVALPRIAQSVSTAAAESPTSALPLPTGSPTSTVLPTKGVPRSLPSHVFLNVPFSPQAPIGNWAQPYKDACEEASVVMAMAWVRGEKTIDPIRANEAILSQVAYENFNFGYHRDTAVRETLKLITHHYGYRSARTAYDITLNQIKAELAAGNLVILPAAGALLKNPYYLNAPPYHMLLVVGYDDLSEEFIVNDPGTRRGRSYRYTYDTVWNAVHDWTGNATTILEGRKAMIVVPPTEDA